MQLVNPLHYGISDVYHFTVRYLHSSPIPLLTRWWSN